MKTSYIKCIIHYSACLCMLMIFGFQGMAQESSQAKAGGSQPVIADAAVQQFVEAFPDHYLSQAYMASPEDAETQDAIQSFVAQNADKIQAKMKSSTESRERDRRKNMTLERERTRVADQRRMESELAGSDPYSAYVEKHKDSPLVQRHLADPNDAKSAEAVRKAMMLEYPERFNLNEESRNRIAADVEAVQFKDQYVQELLDKGASQERAEAEFNRLPESEKADRINKALEQKGYAPAYRQHDAGQDTPTLVPVN